MLGIDVLARSRFRPDSPDRLVGLIGRVKLVSTDVFDTLLLRNSRSERSRIAQGEKLFAEQLARSGYIVSWRTLFEVRTQAQRIAFRALNVRRQECEVDLRDIIDCQLAVLGLPPLFANDRLRIEVDVEKASLSANVELAEILKRHRRAGARVVAVSDTTLPGVCVEDLIRHFHGPDLIDHVYSSADIGLTKRGGAIFAAVAHAENIPLGCMSHIGDDHHADYRVPRVHGVDAHHAPRLFVHRYLRGVDRASSIIGSRWSRGPRPIALEDATFRTPEEFGRAVFGPIVTQFAILIWIYAIEASRKNAAVLLFCARGGIGIREAFERVLQQLGLPLSARRESLMISRLVAARAAVLARSDAAAQELDREFRSNSFADVAAALGGAHYDLPAAWHEPFSGPAFLDLLFSASGCGVLADIERQNALFTQHFRDLIGDSDRIILCDTGLYGSTQRLLECGFPDLKIETVQFARSNYKRHGEEHFPKVTGLLVQQNFYSPFDPATVVLRYWHTIESLFEPAIPSVRSFVTSNGSVLGNCGDIAYGAVDASAGNPLLRGALRYVDQLNAHSGAKAWEDAGNSWRRLHSAVTQPTSADIEVLKVEARSVDFGRSESVDIFQVAERRGLRDKVVGVKTALWREGAIAREFSAIKRPLLLALEAFHALRGLRSRYR